MREIQNVCVFTGSVHVFFFSPTDDTLCKGGPLQRGQTQVPDLHRARGPRDEDVVAFQVPVDDGWGSGVQEVEAFEDLSAPRTQDLDLHDLETLQVAARRPQKKKKKNHTWFHL